jgi:VanZ family protein
MSAVLDVVARRWFIFAALALLVVTGFSLTPRPMPAPPGLTNDKVQHLLAYAAVALPIGLGRARVWPLALLACLGWSLGIEIVQPLVNRTMSAYDLAANATGLGLGALLGRALARLRG